MWQDGLALLIVIIAALMLVRIYAPKFRLGTRCGNHDTARYNESAGGCGGCGEGVACVFKAQTRTAENPAPAITQITPKPMPVDRWSRQQSPTSTHPN